MPITSRLFGMTWHRHPYGSTPDHGCRFAFARSHDYGPPSGDRVRVDNLAPAEGRFTFTAMDEFVAHHYAAGREIIITLFGCPGWLSTTNDETVYGPRGICSPPAEYSKWRVIVRTIAERYAGRVGWFEIWNEPNLPDFWTGTQDQLVELVRETSAAIREAAPDAKIISPAVTSLQNGNGQAYFDQTVAAIAPYVDVFGVHFYPNSYNEIGLLRGLVKRFLAAAKPYNKPIINTEFGVLRPGFASLTPEQRRGALGRLYVATRECISSVWYDGDADSDFGIPVNERESLWNAVQAELTAAKIMMVMELPYKTGVLVGWRFHVYATPPIQ